jgi:hypothetical protein
MFAEYSILNAIRSSRAAIASIATRGWLSTGLFFGGVIDLKGDDRLGRVTYSVVSG